MFVCVSAASILEIISFGKRFALRHTNARSPMLIDMQLSPPTQYTHITTVDNELVYCTRTNVGEADGNDHNDVTWMTSASAPTSCVNGRLLPGLITCTALEVQHSNSKRQTPTRRLLGVDGCPLPSSFMSTRRNHSSCLSLWSTFASHIASSPTSGSSYTHNAITSAFVQELCAGGVGADSAPTVSTMCSSTSMQALLHTFKQFGHCCGNVSVPSAPGLGFGAGGEATSIECLVARAGNSEVFRLKY
jgi:hypothetical protein